MFLCIKVGENDTNVILKCAATSGSVILDQYGDSFERICDKCLALIFVRLRKNFKRGEEWAKTSNLVRSFQFCLFCPT